MRVVACLAALAVLMPGVADAQIRTVDGVQALVRGDYAAAVRILRPLAEEVPAPEPLAQFFMASLYESGQGVPLNPTRACGLYLRAAAKESPIRPQALALAQLIYETGGVLRPQCLEARDYGWVDPPSASFSLGRDHWVRVDRTGLVVGFQGGQKREAVTMGGPGWVYLPVRLTQLDVSRPVQARRHFVEFFIWMPVSTPDEPSWTLHWFVWEVIGADIVALPPGGLLAASTGRQPTPTFDVGAAARIYVNDDGEAEWMVSGPNARRAVVPYRGSR
jgi:hypothetical protein